MRIKKWRMDNGKMKMENASISIINYQLSIKKR